MKFLKYFTVAVTLISSAQLSAQVVVYNFNVQDTVTTVLTGSVSTGVSASLFSVSDGSFTSTNLVTDSPPDTPAVGDTGSWNAATPTKYFAFTITPDSNYTVNLSSISFDYRQTASGALNYDITVGGSTIIAGGTFTRDSTWRQVNHSITTSALTNATEIRIYGYNGGTGSFGIDRVTLSGSVTAVPEPSTYAAILGGVALVGVMVVRRRKSAANAV